MLQRLLPIELIEATVAIATDCEAIEQEVAKRFQNFSDFYYRFSAEQGMQSIGIADFDMMANVVAHTEQYIRMESVRKQVNNAVLILRGRKALVFTSQISTKIVDLR